MLPALRPWAGRRLPGPAARAALVTTSINRSQISDITIYVQSTKRLRSRGGSV